MISSLNNRLLNIVSSAAQYVNVFYLVRIEDNGKVEKLANQFLWGAEYITFTSLSCKKVKLLSTTYYLISGAEAKEICKCLIVLSINFLTDIPIFVILLANCVIGTVIKLAAWLFVEGVLEKNKQFMRLQAKEQFQYQHWLDHPKFQASLSETYQLAVRNKEKKKAYNQFDDLPLDVLKIMASYLSQPSDLYAFGKLSRGCYLASRQIGLIAIPNMKKKFIQTIFPKIFQDCLGVDRLKKAPMVRLAMHRIHDDPLDIRFQKRGEDIIQHHLHLRVQDIGSHAIQWGLEPLPFIAIRVVRRLEKNRSHLSFFESIKKWVKKYPIIVEQQEVITISQVFNTNDWRINFSWDQDNIDINPSLAMNQLKESKMRLMINLKNLVTNQILRDDRYLSGTRLLFDK